MTDTWRRLQPVVIGGAICLVTAGLLESLDADGTVGRSLAPIVSALWWRWFLVAGVVVAAVPAARGKTGRPLGYAFAVGLGIGADLGGLGLTGGRPGLFFQIGWAIFVGLLVASLAGSVGLLLGRGIGAMVRDVIRVHEENATRDGRDE